MVSSANGPTVLCGVRFSSIELKMEFLDNEGTVLRSAEPKFHFKDTRFVNVTLEMLVPDSITRCDSTSFLDGGHLKGQLTLKSDLVISIGWPLQ